MTAVFAANDAMALGLLRALHDVGRDVPGDISVIGFDDAPETAYYWPPLTTVQQDFRRLGRRAFALLSDQLASPASAARRFSVPTRLILRDSIAPPRQAPAG